MEPRISDLFDLTKPHSEELFKDCTYPWEILARLTDVLHETSGEHRGTIMPGAFVADDVDIGEGTVVEPGAVIFGPTSIGKNCQIRAGAYIRGSVWIGNDVVIGHATEVKQAVVLDGAHLAHFNYVGDSVVGYGAHLAAGAILANTKLAPGNVEIKTSEQTYTTGLRKFGAAIGDGAEIGCNAVLNPGSIIGKNSVVYPIVSWRGVLAENMIVKGDMTVVERR